MSALPAATTAANGTEFVSWRHCDVHTRSTFNILSLCLSTLVICVWNVFHPDVPNPKTPRWRVYLARFYGFLVGLFLPEVLVLNAFEQVLAANWFLHKMNGVQSEYLFSVSYWKKLLKGTSGPEDKIWTISYWRKAWRPNVLTDSAPPQWTRMQSFYAIMGGFVAKSTSEVTTLLPEEIEKLCESDALRPLFAADGIDDHSKAGTLGKALLLWQLVVFAISCVARRAEHLPLSLLEITTLAHSMCGIATLELWWDKPHRVDDVVVVPVDEYALNTMRRSEIGHSEFKALNIVLYEGAENLQRAVFISLAVTALYGLPLLLALSTEFPTLAERRCWQVATAIIISTPLFLVSLNWVHGRVRRGGRFTVTIIILLKGAFIVDCLASCFIVAESFRQLFALPSGALLAPALVCYLPHFS